MSKRTKWLIGIGVIATLVMAFQVAAYAVHVDVFQLEGNAVDDNPPLAPAPATAVDDAQNVQAGTQSGSGAGAKAFFTEMPADAHTIYTGGGSKDPNSLDQWRWKTGGGLPDKDNLLHAFAARYTVNGKQLLYFGSDRFDNSGDAVQGFWFFQDQVKNEPGGTFSGEHTEGDLLILTEFSNGGDVSTIVVYKWVGGATTGSLQQVASSNTANCANPDLINAPNANPPGTNDDFCGIVNPASGPFVDQDGLTEAPWGFLDKSGNTDFANGEYFEGGINLTDLGLGGKCFSSFAAETRSSTSTTATLKDFILGEFAVCAPSMTTTASKTSGTSTVAAGTVTPGTAVFDIANLEITGGTNQPDPTGTVTFFLCGPGLADPVTAAGCPETATGADRGTNIGTGTLVDSSTPANTTDGKAKAQSPNVNVAGAPGGVLGAGTYCFRAEWPGGGGIAGIKHTDPQAECFTVQDTSTLTTTQFWIPNDTAKITTQGSAIDGDLEFKLFSSLNDCNGTNANATPLYSENQENVSGASGSTFSTNNDGDGTGTNDTILGYRVENNSADAVTTTGPLYWRVTYTPNATAGHTGSSSVCKEQFTISSDNENTLPAAPPT